MRRDEKRWRFRWVHVSLGVVGCLCLMVWGIGDDEGTRIRVDGTPNEWTGQAVTFSDPAGDGERGYLDLTTGYAFINDDALYFFVDVADSSELFDQLDVIVDADGAVHLFSWPYGQGFVVHASIGTGFRYLGPAYDSRIAFRNGFEGRIDLADLGLPKYSTRIREINVIAREGEDTHTVDAWKPLSAPRRVREPDAELVRAEARDVRPGHVLVLDPSIEAGYRYRGQIQIAVGAAWGQGGLHVADPLGKDIVRISLAGSMESLGTWRDSGLWSQLGPMDVAFDSSDRLYVSDMLHVYAVDSSGNLQPVPGTDGHYVDGIAFDRNDVLYFSDSIAESVYRVDSDSNAERVAGGIPMAYDLAFGNSGTLFVSQHGGSRVVSVDVETGAVSEVFSGPQLGPAQIYLAVDADGDLWARGENSILQFSPDGTPKPFILDGETYPGWAVWPGFGTSGGIAFDDSGRLWLAAYNSCVRVFEPIVPGMDAFGMTSRIIAPGFQPVQDMEVDRSGSIYAYNNNPAPGELWRIDPTGKAEVLLEIEQGGSIGMAFDAHERLYLGLPSGEIAWLDSAGRLRRYASLRSLNMAFAEDGALYAAVGDHGERKVVMRVTGPDDVDLFLESLDGRPLGREAVHVDPAPGGIYVCDEERHTIHFVDFDGRARRVAEVPGGFPIAVAASPDGEIFAVPAGGPPYGYTLLRISPDGAREVVATGLLGDPLAAVVSPDGRWLYVAENGAIDVFSIPPEE